MYTYRKLRPVCQYAQAYQSLFWPSSGIYGVQSVQLKEKTDQTVNLCMLILDELGFMYFLALFQLKQFICTCISVLAYFFTTLFIIEWIWIQHFSKMQTKILYPSKICIQYRKMTIKCLVNRSQMFLLGCIIILSCSKSIVDDFPINQMGLP